MNYTEFVDSFRSSSKMYKPKDESFDSYISFRVYNVLVANKVSDALMLLEDIEDKFQREYIMNEVLGLPAK
ncbi:MAG: hypothetical protein R2685_11045 [Candidatus Nitrosocosmicus sp.]|nr:hypothetical protein [Candidatus Nitrosocosmicus sp.]